MKRKKVGARIIAVALLSLLMILLTGCNGGKKEASALSTSSAVAEAAEPLSVAGNTEHVEGKVYTFDKDNAYKFSSDGEVVSTSAAQAYGTFNISGIELTAEPGKKNGIASYSVPEGHPLM